MRKYTNECCACASPGYPCLGSDCPLLNVLHIYCNKCREEITDDDFFTYENLDLHEECVIDFLVEKEVIKREAASDL